MLPEEITPPERNKDGLREAEVELINELNKGAPTDEDFEKMRRDFQELFDNPWTSP